MPDPRSIQLPIFSESARFEVSRKLGKTEFACDLSVCHGACCTMPADAGAPILESEIAELERVFPIVKKYLSEESIETIEQTGVWQRERDGSLTIPAIRGRDCIFVTYENDNSGIAFCAIEKAYRASEIEDFPKPISCHLFPIRIYPKKDTFEIVYEKISECKGGRTRGKRERMPLLDFLETPLVRALGEKRIKHLRQAFKIADNKSNKSL